MPEDFALIDVLNFASGIWFGMIFGFPPWALRICLNFFSAFFVASASFRAFRVRNLEATLLLLTGCILMLGRVPIADYIPFLRPLQEWLYSFPNVAGQRVIMIGIALGMVGTSVRIILGYEKSFMGDK